MKRNSIIIGLFFLLAAYSCTHPGKENSSNNEFKTIQSKFINTDCKKGAVINPNSVDSLITAAFQNGGSLIAYNDVKNFYSFYKKDYLLLSMAMKYSNLYQSSQASFDVYSILSNFYEHDYCKTLNDCRSKKIALFYLFKSYKEDQHEPLTVAILKSVFGESWNSYKDVDFLNAQNCKELPQLRTYRDLKF